MAVAAKPKMSPALAASGRRYPEHLKEYERYDSLFLPILSEHEGSTSRQLAQALFDKTDDFKTARNARFWAASADWRGLVKSGEEPRSSRTYSISTDGKKLLSRLSS